MIIIPDLYRFRKVIWNGRLLRFGKYYFSSFCANRGIFWFYEFSACSCSKSLADILKLSSLGVDHDLPLRSQDLRSWSRCHSLGSRSFFRIFQSRSPLKNSPVRKFSLISCSVPFLLFEGSSTLNTRTCAWLTQNNRSGDRTSRLKLKI